MARVFQLESGFHNENEEREKAFANNKYFIVRWNHETKKLMFCTMNSLFDGTKEQGAFWVTTPAKVAEESADKRYVCFETESGTRYHLWQVGTAEVIRDNGCL